MGSMIALLLDLAGMYSEGSRGSREEYCTEYICVKYILPK